VSRQVSPSRKGVFIRLAKQCGWLLRDAAAVAHGSNNIMCNTPTVFFFVFLFLFWYDA